MDVNDFSKTSGTERICIVGLGYVGLPLAILFSKKYNVTGYDIDEQRILDLKNGIDVTEEVKKEDLLDAGIYFTANAREIRQCKTIIVTVPTPINEDKYPDLKPIISSTKTIASNMSIGSIVVYESTVYPCLTEEVCIPLLESHSETNMYLKRMKWKTDFNVGYSPERTNPGDKVHWVGNTNKIVAGDTEETSNFLAELYGNVIDAKIHIAPNIRTAEAAKIIENTQRDLNIALINELALIFHKMDIDTKEVLEAAGTKWNFHKYEPGLVGGHCLKSSQLITFKRDNDVHTISIKDYINLYYNKENLIKDKILSFDFDERKLVFNDILEAKVRKHNKIINITTERNHKVSITDDHPVVVFENNSVFIKHAKDIVIGDKIPIFHNTEMPKIFNGKSFNLDLISMLPIEWFKKIRVKIKNDRWINYKDKLQLKKTKNIQPENYFIWDYLPLNIFLKLEIDGKMPISRNDIYLVTGRGPSLNKISNVIKIDGEFARFIGYYLSEGCVTKDKSMRTRFTFNENEQQYINDVISVANTIGVSHSVWHNKKDHCIHIKISSNILGFLMKDILKCGVNCYEKNIPSIVFYNKKLNLFVLSGILRGDGSLHKTKDNKNGNYCQMTFCSSSNVLFNQVCYILLSHGINYSTHINKQSPKSQHLIILGGRNTLKKIISVVGDIAKNNIEKHLKEHAKNIKMNYEFSNGLWVVPVKDITTETKDQEVFSIDVKDSKTIITNFGIITHNCIGVDPYYLTYKSELLGHHPEVILSGRRINDNMGKYIAENTVKKLIEANKQINGANILILGITFKENVPDVRNSRVGDIYKELIKYHTHPFIYDPKADDAKVKHEYGIDLCPNPEFPVPYSAIIVAVKHTIFSEMFSISKLREMSSNPPIIIDIKGLYDKKECLDNGFVYWRL